MNYGYGGKLVIFMRELVELVFWEDLPTDGIIVRSVMKKIRIP